MADKLLIDRANPDEVELLKWKSQERVYKKRGKDFFSTVIVIAVLVSIIMFFIEGVMPVVLIWAVVFVMWAINKTPPKESEHQMTSWGIRTGGNLYVYGNMVCYWFEEKWGTKVMYVLMERGFPKLLMILVNANDEEKIRKVMKQVGLPMQKLEPSRLDKMVKWLGEKVPLDD